MKLAIMQPYIFPYIGYFQLITAVDRFVVYDDVTYIKQGWINRNRILANRDPLYFTIPLSGASSHTPIFDTKINLLEYTKWRDKFYKSLKNYYGKSPQFDTIMPLIQNVFADSPEYLVDVVVKSIKSVCHYLQIPTDFVDSSRQYKNNHLKAQERVMDICKQEKADSYINMIGGMELYSRSDFMAHGIKLKFMKSKEIIYTQSNKPFVPCLSIIDVLMFNRIDNIKDFLNIYELV